MIGVVRNGAGRRSPAVPLRGRKRIQETRVIVGNNNAYSEGWGLYAEQLADELGAYSSDPVGRLGYLQSIAFRACRLVVDTGRPLRTLTAWIVASRPKAVLS